MMKYDGVSGLARVFERLFQGQNYRRQERSFPKEQDGALRICVAGIRNYSDLN